MTSVLGKTSESDCGLCQWHLRVLSVTPSEAPWPIVVALTTTATLTVLIFFFADIPLQLAGDLAGVSNR